MHGQFTVLRILRKKSTSTLTGILGVALGAEPPELTVDTGELTEDEVRDLRADPASIATPVMPTQLIAPVSAEPTASNWGISAIGADLCPFDGSGVTVAVLDTGIDHRHQAFRDVGLDLRDFTGRDPHDVNGHGTHCAGTLVGGDVDGVRIGVARRVDKLLVGKILDDEGHGTTDGLFRGIQWALASGAKVISMSLGFDFPGLVQQRVANGWPVALATSTALDAYRANLRAMDRLMSFVDSLKDFGQDAVVVAAAGNESRRKQDASFSISVTLPAVADGVISVGALERTDDGKLRVADFSNTFPKISAPGVGILSAEANGNLKSLTGTSMAAPHVAGVAALWWQALRATGETTTSEVVVRKLLTGTTNDNFASGVPFAERGAGMVTAPTSAHELSR